MTRAPRATHTRDVPCPQCGQSRPLRGRYDVDFRRAAGRLCSNCKGGAARDRAFAGFTTNDEVDWVVVERLITGRPVEANTAEKREAVTRLRRRGENTKRIAELLRISDRVLLRLEQAIKEREVAA